MLSRSRHARLIRNMPACFAIRSPSPCSCDCRCPRSARVPSPESRAVSTETTFRRPDEAIAVMRESLTLIQELRDKFAFVHALVPLAAAAALKGDDAWAARILGARDAVTERTGATIVDKWVDDLRQQAERDARARLGADRWARAYAAGRGTSIDTLLKEIDRVT